MPKSNASKVRSKIINESMIGPTTLRKNNRKNVFNGSLSNSKKQVAGIYDQGLAI